MRRFIIIISILTAACTPKLYSPQVVVPDNYLHSAGFAIQGDTIGNNWWEVFDDTTLNNLVVRALDNNRDLAAAASRIEASRMNLSVVRSQFLPAVTLNASAQASYSADTKIIQQYAVRPTLSWEVSLFGAMKNSSRAARAGILASEWAYDGVKLSLAAEVATAYFTLLQYEHDLRIAKSSCTLRRESAALIDSLFRYGMSNGVALQQSKSLIYSAASDIALYTRAVEQTRLSIDSLLGETPGYVSNNYNTAEQRLLSEKQILIPIGLPSDLLYRRPDILQAYYSMQQSAANVGIARAARFPSISLTGSGGVLSNAIKSLTSGEPWVWGASASLMQPLFSFSGLKRKEQMAKESYNQTMYAYEQSILTAFIDVESALVQITTYHDQIQRYQMLVDANYDIATMTDALYTSGMSAYLDVIDAQRNLYDSQMELTNLTAQQYINYINLYRVLGGGWE